MDRRRARVAAGISMALIAGCPPAAAQHRTRVTLGPQVKPSYPGADGYSVRPFVDVSRAEGDAPFAFEAPDDSSGFTLLTLERLTIGTAFAFEGSRSRADVGGKLPKVGSTVELGGFVQYALNDALRARAEVRQGIGGHRGLIIDVGADYVARRGDDWLFSFGPRVAVGSGRYNRAYFGVTPADAAASGLRAFSAGGGIESVGLTAGYLRQLTPRWGIAAYAKYERLVGDPADSPIVARFGSRDQPSAGVALSYTFGSGVAR